MIDPEVRSMLNRHEREIVFLKGTIQILLDKLGAHSEILDGPIHDEISADFRMDADGALSVLENTYGRYHGV